MDIDPEAGEYAGRHTIVESIVQIFFVSGAETGWYWSLLHLDDEGERAPHGPFETSEIAFRTARLTLNSIV